MIDGRLGDRVSHALGLVGINEDRVSKWLGKPCGCNERRQKLNRLGAWATRVVRGKRAQAERYLEQILNEQ